ncbi:MAG: ABC transporter permease subunit [Clostridia bacterium]|nr:ABC transporter permease subunit [Clostridia bacterium]
MKQTQNLSAENSPATKSASCSTDQTAAARKKRISYAAKAAAVLGALFVWQAAAWAVGSKLLLASPVEVIKRMFSLAFGGGDFWSTALYSFSRIALGFFGGLAAGILLAVAAGRFRVVETLLFPYMVTIRSIPVASFVILALIWLTASKLASFVSFLMVMPIVYTNVLAGIRSVDPKLLEMARVFRVPPLRKLRCIWLPGLKSHLVSACEISLGLAWKSGIAAELIGYPTGSVGEKLYYSKVYLDTVDLFAWTVFIVLFSVGFAKLFLAALKRLLEVPERRWTE